MVLPDDLGAGPKPVASQPLAEALVENEDAILSELLEAQGQAVDLGGYYHPDPQLCSKAMRPSPTFNAILDGLHCLSS